MLEIVERHVPAIFYITSDTVKILSFVNLHKWLRIVL
jgi:hypothetical protein